MEERRETVQDMEDAKDVFWLNIVRGKKVNGGRYGERERVVIVSKYKNRKEGKK